MNTYPDGLVPMGPKGSKRAPGGTAPGGSRFGSPDDGSISALGKPDLRGSTIMPPLRHLRQEGIMGKQVWQADVGEEGDENVGKNARGSSYAAMSQPLWIPFRRIVSDR